MSITELQTLFFNAITTSIFVGFIISMILLFFGKK